MLKINTVVILAGGYGSRLGNLTNRIPKPLVVVGGKPILLHIMDGWKRAGVTKFIIAGGYRAKDLQKLNYENYAEVQVVDTGLGTETATRISRTLHLINEKDFAVSYGDAITTFPLRSLLDEHLSHSPRATLLAVRPHSRFGEIRFGKDGQVSKFIEKPKSRNWISGGFFVFSKYAFNSNTSMGSIEYSILPQMAMEGQVRAMRCGNFWQCMDTPKEVALLNRIWVENGEKWPNF